ncbi:MAG: CinA family nicotinamide mononucleotide deamidase-related protein [Anaerolineales bacterium]|nr:CinA family nicotinamide mononucleotide deamidase-related protein [Anaerolineales bacterium]
MATAEIITIGTELLLGETVDTNTRFLARTLRGLGVNLYRAVTIGDNVDRIAEAVRDALGRAEIVITTGGLGPTVDDPTRQALAQAVGVQVEFRDDLWAQIQARIRRYGRTASENQRRQAYVPQGAIAIENPVGTAPAFIVEADQRVVIALPGVPSEMETLLTEAVVPFLQRRFDLREVIRVRTLHTAGIGEGMVDELIGDLEALSNPTVGLSAHAGIIDVRIAARAENEAAADRMLGEIEADLRNRLGAIVYGVDDDSLEGTVLAALAQRGWTLAGLESGLNGDLLRRLARTGDPAYQGGEQLEEDAAPLGASLRSVRQRQAASTGLAVRLVLQGEQMDIFLAIQTPDGDEQDHWTYGGHPRNAPRWAANMALERLRRRALDIRG